MSQATLNTPEDTRQHHDTKTLMMDMGARARNAATTLALTPRKTKDAALLVAAMTMRAEVDKLMEANAHDIKIAQQQGKSPAFIDRLRLTDSRIEGISVGLEVVASLPDPVGNITAHLTPENGLDIDRVQVPLGVVGMVYESRPNVTADAAALCLKSGNSVILRGGSACAHSNRVIHSILIQALNAAIIEEDAVQLVPTGDRKAVDMMLAGLDGTIDVIIPRGGKSLVAAVHEKARVPVFAHLEGVCHVYVDEHAEPDMAQNIVINAKMRRPSICGAAETLLIDAAYPKQAAKTLIAALCDAGCEVRGDAQVCQLDARAVPAKTSDWTCEYGAPVITAGFVRGVDGAIDHISRFGSNHTDSIVTSNAANATAFVTRVDSAIVMHNASTQFADGGEFGMGAEIGIATGRFHARGPVALEQLTTNKYVVRGQGHVRP